MVTTQRLGEIDAVCRSIENELLASPSSSGAIDMRPHYYLLLADSWIGDAYAICYILNNRKLVTDEPFKQLLEDLRLVRVQLEKYEIPSDRDLVIEMTTGAGAAGPPATHVYDYKDPRRSHIGRRGFSERRSAMWEVLEVKSEAHRWLERQDLADRFLNVFSRHSG
jgi:hypothetical protein